MEDQNELTVMMAEGNSGNTPPKMHDKDVQKMFIDALGGTKGSLLST